MCGLSVLGFNSHSIGSTERTYKETPADPDPLLRMSWDHARPRTLLGIRRSIDKRVGTGVVMRQYWVEKCPEEYIQMTKVE